MSSSPSSATASPSTADLGYASPGIPTAKPARLASLDIFRGMTIAGMLLVNNMGGPKYDPFEHASWNGWTPTDLVFPFFAFIMGVAIPFSFAKRGGTDSRKDLFLHAWSRGLALFLLGEFGYALPYLPYPSPTGIHLARHLFAYLFLFAGFVVLLYPWKSKRVSLLVPPVTAVVFLLTLFGIHFFNQYLIDNGTVPDSYAFGGGLLTPTRLRIPGVLQRLGVCYAVAASLTLLFNARPTARESTPSSPSRGWKPLAAVAFLILAGYAAVMLTVPYPSLTQPGTTVHGRLDHDENLARYVDETLLGSKAHPLSWGTHTYSAYPDPEGILSTLPAIGTTLLGVLAGLWLRTARPLAEKCAGLFAFGVIACILASYLDFALMPINKQLWSSSYVVMCAGLALLGLGTYFYLVDVLNYRRLFAPFTWYGMNAITAFVLAGIVPRITSMIRWPNPDEPGKVITLGATWSKNANALGRHITLGDPAKNGSLTYALSFVLVFLVIMWALHKMRIYLKV
jgi:predicted acyltransferase